MRHRSYFQSHFTDKNPLLFQGHRICEYQNQCVDSHLPELKNLYISRLRWYMPVVLASSTLRQEDYELQTNLGYFVWSCQKQKIPRLLDQKTLFMSLGVAIVLSNGCH